MIPASGMPAFMCFNALSVSARGNVDRATPFVSIACRPSAHVVVTGRYVIDNNDGWLVNNSVPRLDPVRIGRASAEQDDENNEITHV